MIWIAAFFVLLWCIVGFGTMLDVLGIFVLFVVACRIVVWFLIRHLENTPAR